MRSNSNLIEVVMDGIRDTGMLYDYAETAAMEDNKTLCDWFRKKADERLSRTESEWSDAKSVLKLDESKDDMAVCLRRHIENEMSMRRMRGK